MARPSGSRLVVLALSLLPLDAWAQAPPAASFAAPGVTSWRPDGCRAVPTHDGVIGARDRWKLLHGDVLNGNEVAIALAPLFAADWDAEPDTFNAAGVTFDAAGNLYFTPFLPHEDVILISLDPRTGARRFAIPGRGAPTGAVAPMVLADPDHPGQEIVYVALYDRAVAVRTDGTIVWDVPTGLTLDPLLAHAAVPGINYSPAADAIVATSSDGHVYLLDRRTGAALLAAPFVLPGAPSPPSPLPIPQALVDQAQAELAPLVAFPAGSSFSDFLGAILGNGVAVSNSFSIDPQSGRLWIAATAPDDADGSVDGVSQYGALYGLDAAPLASGGYQLVIGCSIDFAGGSASTPALLADGSRIYLGDNQQNLLAIDPSCTRVWSLPLGSQITGAIAVASDGHELYAATQADIFKVVDGGAAGAIVWKANLDAYRTSGTEQSFNLLLASIGANGIGFMAGAGIPSGQEASFALPFSVGYGVLDRASGAIRYFADGLDESVAELNVGPDGAFYSPSSPVRRAFARALYPASTPPLQGGIRKFAPRRQALLVRDAVCAAADRADNAVAGASRCADSAAADGADLQLLVAQALRTAPLALGDGSLTAAAWSCVAGDVTAASGAVGAPAWAAAATTLRRACGALHSADPCGASRPGATRHGCAIAAHDGGAGAAGLALAAAVLLTRARRRRRA